MSDRTTAVYVQTNESDTNRVIAFTRAADGGLAELGIFETGGAGDGVPHLTSQGSVVLTGDGRHLLVTNAGSDDLTVFTVRENGLELLLTAPTGIAPKSVAEHDGLIYVLNTGGPSLIGFRLTDDSFEEIEDSIEALDTDADPAQVGFGPQGRTLVVTDRATDSIVTFAVGDDGLLAEPLVNPSSGPTPYGFAFTRGGTLVVTEAFGAQTGKAAASSYRLENGGVAPVTRSVGNGRSEICWAVVSADDRYAFTTNFADGAVSRYAIAGDGTITLEDAAAGLAVEGSTGLRDEDLSGDGKYLYAIDADSRRIFGWSVGPEGSLAPVGSWEGIPATVAGIAAS
jgi:6-phosphogluconolactonase (cycloisomerase 2 family)